MENTKTHCCKMIKYCILASSIALAGYFIGNSFAKAKLLGTVTVKGSAERQVEADLGIWPLLITSTGNDLFEVNNKIETDRKLITKFLLEQGFRENEITIGDYNLTDKLANNFSDNKDSRYIITASVIIKTNNISLIDRVSKNKNLLIQKGVVLAASDYSRDNSPYYEFTKFNDVKPEMLTEAIKNARLSAERFANDSGSKVGRLKNANQGIFLISATDQFFVDSYQDSLAERKSIRKKIRVVTTLEYFLSE